MAPTKTFDDLSSSLDERIGGLRKNYDSALESYFQSPQITPSQALIQGVLNVLPMIIGGAVAKKKGALLGAQAGKLGADAYVGGVAAENKRKQDNAGLEAKRISDELQTTIGQKQQTELAGIKENATASRFNQSEQNKFARTGATNAATIKAAQEMKMNPAETDVWESAKGARQTERRASNVLNIIEKMGSPTESTPEALMENAFAYYANQGGDRAEMQRELKEMALAGKAILGPGQLTNQEREVLDLIVGGSWKVPIQTVNSLMTKITNKQYEGVNDSIDIANEGGFRMNFPKMTPKDVRLRGGAVAPQAKGSAPGTVGGSELGIPRPVQEVLKLYPNSSVEKMQKGYGIRDAQGNAIAVVDPQTGEFLWSAE